MGNSRMRASLVSLAAIAIVVAACSGGGGSSKAATATSAEGMGGMEELVKAAEAEGALNVIAVPPEWANYKGVLEKFKAKYPKIKVDEQGLDFNSQQEIDALNSQAGTDKAPDVLDLAPSVALANTALFAPYQVAAWADIPANLKEATGLWFSDYAGFTSDRLRRQQGGGAGDRGRHAEARVQGHDRPQRQPQVGGGRPPRRGHGRARQRRFGRRHLRRRRVLQRAQRRRATCCRSTRRRRRSPSGQTPCVIDWEYNNAALTADLKTKGIDWQVSVPSDAPPVASYYYQAINKEAPHPAAARLWEEFLYTPEAQNSG